MKTADLSRQHGISDATLYNWEAKYGGLNVSEAARLRSHIESSASPPAWTGSKGETA
jgi:putative transposase